MKITVEVNPEDLAIITEQVMKAAGPEAMSKIWIAIGNQIVGTDAGSYVVTGTRGFPAVFRHAVAFDVRKKIVITLGVQTTSESARRSQRTHFVEEG